MDFARAKICSYDETDKICFKRLKTITPEIHPSLFQHVGRLVYVIRYIKSSTIIVNEICAIALRSLAVL